MHWGVGAALEIVKSASPTAFTRHGQVITYSYVVTNTGNVTMRDVIVTDTRFGPVSCPRQTLVPGASMTWRTSYPIAAVDLGRGSIFDSSSAAGRSPAGRRVHSPPSRAIVVVQVVVPPGGRRCR